MQPQRAYSMAAILQVAFDANVPSVQFSVHPVLLFPEGHGCFCRAAFQQGAVPLPQVSTALLSPGTPSRRGHTRSCRSEAVDLRSTPARIAYGFRRYCRVLAPICITFQQHGCFT